MRTDGNTRLLIQGLDVFIEISAACGIQCIQQRQAGRKPSKHSHRGITKTAALPALARGLQDQEGASNPVRLWNWWIRKFWHYVHCLQNCTALLQPRVSKRDALHLFSVQLQTDWVKVSSACAWIVILLSSFLLRGSTMDWLVERSYSSSNQMVGIKPIGHMILG